MILMLDVTSFDQKSALLSTRPPLEIRLVNFTKVFERF